MFIKVFDSFIETLKVVPIYENGVLKRKKA